MLKHFRFGILYFVLCILYFCLADMAFTQDLKGEAGLFPRGMGAGYVSERSGLPYAHPGSESQTAYQNRSPKVVFPGIRRLVPGEYPTIQAAIDACVDGDTVLVSEGTYFENIRYKGKAIMVASYFILDSDTNHINNTVINGSSPSHPDSASVVYFVSGEDTTSVLEGFTITGGTGTKYIVPGTAPNQCSGGGIFLWAGGKIEWNKIINNHLNTVAPRYTHGAGMTIVTESNAIVRNNLIANNTIHAFWGGGAGVLMYCMTDGFTLFEKNKLVNNIYEATEGGGHGGMYIGGATEWLGTIIVRNNIITKNQGNCDPPTSITAGGIYIETCSPQILNNVISENITNGNGGGINVWTYSGGTPAKPVIINNTITRNKAGHGGGLYTGEIGTLLDVFVMNSIIWGDTATSSYNEIYIQFGSFHIVNSDIKGGEWSNINNGCFDISPCFSIYSLMESSPCIGLGRSSYTYNNFTYHAPTFDLNDNPRPNGVDSLIDIGAIESSYPCKVHPHSCSTAKYLHPANDSLVITSDIFNLYNHGLQVFSTIMSKDSTLNDSLEMYDDGNHHDGSANDGLYGTVREPFLEENEFELTGISIADQQTNDHFTFNHHDLFTTIGPVVFEGFSNVGIEHPAPGYTNVRFKPVLKNCGLQATATSVQSEVIPLDTSQISFILNKFQNYGDITAGQSKTSSFFCTISFHGTLPPIVELLLKINISSNNYVFWQSETTLVVGIKESESLLPISYQLYQNYPNPFNPTTTIKFDLPKSSQVTLKIFNILGEEVVTLVSGRLTAGSYSYEWDGSDVASGVYLYRLETEGFVQTKKMILMQ